MPAACCKAAAPIDSQRWDAEREGLRQHCPVGVDIYDDNVGGEILATVLAKINLKARIIICGAINQDTTTTAVAGPKNCLSLLVSRARMAAIAVFDCLARHHLAIAERAAYRMHGRMTHKAAAAPARTTTGN